MIKIDGAYLYELGAQLRPINSLVEKDTTKIGCYFIIGPATTALNKFIHESVFSPQLKTVRNSALQLQSMISKFHIEFTDISTFEKPVLSWEIAELRREFSKFEIILLAELQNSPLYMVMSKGGFDILCLTDSGLSIFPSQLSEKVPEAVDDVEAGAKCIAFELFTAAGFHFHRANEAVLRKYFDVVAGSNNKPRSKNMGDLLKKMEDLSAGDAKVIAVLKSIKDLHRNPLMHPGDRIESADEALSLYAAIRAAIGYMIERIPTRAIVRA